jgi:GxxExxY protein
MKVSDPLTEGILGAAIEVHRTLGPGLLESVYEESLCHELALQRLAFQRQVACPVSYKGVALDCGFRADVVVQEEIILEIKAVERLLPVHSAQLITYLKLARIPKGLLVNFNVTPLRQGIRRLHASPDGKPQGEMLISSQCSLYLPVRERFGDSS